MGRKRHPRLSDSGDEPSRLGSVRRCLRHLGHPVPVRPHRGSRRDDAVDARLGPDHARRRRAPAARLARRRARPDASVPALARPVRDRRGDHPVSGHRLRRTAGVLVTGGDRRRLGAPDRRGSRPPLRPQRAADPAAGARPAHRLRRRRGARRDRRRRADERVARDSGDPDRGGRVRDRADGHQAPARAARSPGRNGRNARDRIGRAAAGRAA